MRTTFPVFGLHGIIEIVEGSGCRNKSEHGKPFNITVIQVYAPTNNAEEGEIEWFCEEDL